MLVYKRGVGWVEERGREMSMDQYTEHRNQSATMLCLNCQRTLGRHFSVGGYVSCLASTRAKARGLFEY